MSYISKRLSHFDSNDFRNAIKKQSLITDPVDLSIGIPEELTAEHVKAAGIKAIKENKTTYLPANGLLDLRLAIAKKLDNENNINCNAENITIVPGLTTGLLLVYLALLDQGDEVIVLDPYYPPYPHLASMVGAHVIYVSTYPSFHPDLSLIEASITSRTKMLVINSPNNPTGAVYDEITLRKIAQLAERHNLLILADEIYEHFTFDKKHFSLGSIYPNTVTMNGFSKQYAMTGWRLGYIEGPLDIIDAINNLQQYIVMSSSSIAQYAGLSAINHPPKISTKYHDKRNYLVNELRKSGVQIQGAEGAFYLYIKTPGNMTDIEFTEKASSKGLIILPGRAFSQRNDFVRISYGSEMNDIKRGVKILHAIVNEPKNSNHVRV